MSQQPLSLKQALALALHHAGVSVADGQFEAIAGVLSKNLVAAPCVQLTDDIINGLANMCEAANSAHPVRSFVVSANDLFPVAVFIHSIHKAAKDAESKEPAA